MKVQNKTFNQQSFQAKFLNSEALQQIAQYAVEKGEFQKLNRARKNIDKSRLTTLLKVDVFKKENKCGITFTRYIPKVIVPKTMNDYYITNITTYESTNISNPLEFGLQKIIKLGNNAPHNNMFREVVIRHQHIIK